METTEHAVPSILRSLEPTKRDKIHVCPENLRSRESSDDSTLGISVEHNPNRDKTGGSEKSAGSNWSVKQIT
jgi:hypothetical protein